MNGFGGSLQGFHDDEHQALLDALAPGWDHEDPVHAAECFGMATALTIAWAINRRLEAQALASGMLEVLAEWESILRLRPVPGTPDIERRRRVAAKFRVLARNTLGDIADACREALGVRFTAIHTADPASAITYWPNINPGPPEMPWSTSRVRIGVEMTKDGMTDLEFAAVRSSLVSTLDSFIPGWMTFSIGVGSAFVVNQGIVGQTLL